MIKTIRVDNVGSFSLVGALTKCSRIDIENKNVIFEIKTILDGVSLQEELAECKRLFRNVYSFSIRYQ